MCQTWLSVNPAHISHWWVNNTLSNTTRLLTSQKGLEFTSGEQKNQTTKNNECAKRHFPRVATSTEKDPGLLCLFGSFFQAGLLWDALGNC